MKKILILIFALPIFCFAQSKEELLKQVKDNPKEVSTLRIIQKIGGYEPDYKELNNLFKSLDKKVKKSNDGKLFERYLEALKNTQIGKKAPSITQLDLNGEPYSLTDLKGKFVLIDFWAAWCPDCRRQNPSLVKLYSKFKDQNFEILGVSFDREYDSWVKAIKDDQLTWKHVSDLQHWNNAAGQTYGVKAIPQNILVDPQGIIIGRNLHGDKLEQKLAELLK
ncbi:peroxiredoxin family protein [Sphingobacterium sp. HJSM2_6]|uniref:peroxiredoxin family protein n=1 Tax=Sphingobacterium sp. HJSM2_6 TaxID=3366264 RepID=UPI003BEE227F